MIITVDGMPASGKGSLARQLGEYYRLPVLDTGALWRILAIELKEWMGTWNVEVDDAVRAQGISICENFPIHRQSDQYIRGETCGELASRISCDKDLRYWVDQIQREFIADGSGILDGRECGISIAPKADHKFFLQAEVGIRALWRSRQLYSTQLPIEVDAVEKALITRDRREINRDVSPIRPAADAIIITTSSFDTPGQVFDYCRRLIDFRQDWARTLKLNRLGV